MKRIIIHWTAGTHKASALDKKHYHFIIEGDGKVIDGNLPPEANLDTSTPYAAHTRMANTGAIGVSVAAMAGAKDWPLNVGKYPITKAQEASLTRVLDDLTARYNIPVTREAVLTHAEVQPTLGIRQNGKWDIAWLPGMDRVGDPVTVGDLLRQRVRDYRAAQSRGPTIPPRDSTPPAGGVWAALAALLNAVFGKARK